MRNELLNHLQLDDLKGETHVVSAALDEVQASVFSALADEKPELYRQVVQFLDKKRKEGL